MQDVGQALHEVKELYQRMLGKPAPEIDPGSYIPFPPGADPIQLAVEEVRQIKALSEAMAKAPSPAAWVPRADCFATKDGFVIQIEVPGVLREDLKVFAVGPELVVRGERKGPARPAEMRALSIERPWGPFERRFALPLGKISDRVTARYLHGILELRIAGEPVGAIGETPVEVS